MPEEYKVLLGQWGQFVTKLFLGEALLVFALSGGTALAQSATGGGPPQAQLNAVETLSNQLTRMDAAALPSPDRLEATMNETLIKHGLEANEKSRRTLGNILLQEQKGGVPGYDILTCIQEGKPMELSGGVTREMSLTTNAKICSIAIAAYQASKRPKTKREIKAAIAGGLLDTWVVATQCSDLFYVRGGVFEQLAFENGVNIAPLQKAVWAVLFGQSSEGADTELLEPLKKVASNIQEDIRLNHKTFCDQWGKIGIRWGSLGSHSKPPQQ